MDLKSLSKGHLSFQHHQVHGSRAQGCFRMSLTGAAWMMEEGGGGGKNVLRWKQAQAGRSIGAFADT